MSGNEAPEPGTALAGIKGEVLMRVLAMILLPAALLAQTDMRPPYMGPRIGRDKLNPKEPQVVTGMLVDASCQERSALNLRETPEVAPKPLPKQSSGGVSAFGVTVDARTAEQERQEALEHQVPDLRMRQADPTCAITAETRSFALLLDDGRLLGLDQGGNTKAAGFLQADPAGRALLNGVGPAVKPRVTIKGRVHATQLVVDQFMKVGGPT
jgi:hypothetical protein